MLCVSLFRPETTTTVALIRSAFLVMLPEWNRDVIVGGP
jgi:hypothetical protein